MFWDLVCGIGVVVLRPEIVIVRTSQNPSESVLECPPTAEEHSTTSSLITLFFGCPDTVIPCTQTPSDGGILLQTLNLKPETQNPQTPQS